MQLIAMTKYQFVSPRRSNFFNKVPHECMVEFQKNEEFFDVVLYGEKSDTDTSMVVGYRARFTENEFSMASRMYYIMSTAMTSSMNYCMNSSISPKNEGHRNCYGHWLFYIKHLDTNRDTCLV